MPRAGGRVLPRHASRISGIGLSGIEQKLEEVHAKGWLGGADVLPVGGFYKARRRARRTPGRRSRSTRCRSACDRASYDIWKQYSAAMRANPPIHLRDLLDFKPLGKPVPIEEVESITEIRKRFVTPGMSLGALWPGGARDAEHRHEPHRREVRLAARAAKTRRVQARAERRQPNAPDQADRLGPVRRDGRISERLRGARDQGRAGRQARRGRPAARLQGDGADRAAAPCDARRDADLAAAAPRHLFDRGSGAAHLRPEADQPARQGLREAGRRVAASARSPRAWPRPRPTSS